MHIDKKLPARVQNSYLQGGEVNPHDEDAVTHAPDEKHDASWLPGRKGQGGEGLSEGYGGSEGSGTKSSGPSDDGQ